MPEMIWSVIPVVAHEAYTDYKTGKLNPWIFAIMVLAILPCAILLNPYLWLNCLIGGIVGGIAYLFVAIFFKGGGGDIVMMSAIGFCIGLRYFTLVIVISSIFQLIATLIKAKIKKKKIRKTQVPYAPSVLFGLVCVGIYYIV